MHEYLTGECYRCKPWHLLCFPLLFADDADAYRGTHCAFRSYDADAYCGTHCTGNHPDWDNQPGSAVGASELKGLRLLTSKPRYALDTQLITSYLMMMLCVCT
eukprot:scaffold175983_cov21-Tisochrysis_lutea.AAC.1